MSNGEKYLQVYAELEKFLNKEGAYESYTTFAQKVKNSNNKAVNRFKDELLSFADLRNAIIHNPKIGEKLIAEPHESTLQRLILLSNEIRNPKKVIPEFQFDVLGAKQEEHIKGILTKMVSLSFSQFPVFDDNFHVAELINTNTISRWLSSEIDETSSILTEETKVKDLIEHIEFKQNYKFVNRNNSLYEAYDIFIKQIDKEQRNLDVIFITHSGKENEKLLGLITIEDIANKVKL